MRCSYEGCDFECYENNDKCIFHCTKDNWFTPKRKIWIQKKVGEFWEAIRTHKTQINNKFIGFVFPRFEKYECDFHQIIGDKHITVNHNEISTKNFGLRGNHSYYYAYIQSVSFEKCIFLDDANFSKIALHGNNDFTEVIFKKDILFPSNNIENLDFTKSIFEQDVVLSQKQLKNCDFTQATFNKIADFSELNISTNVIFDESIYENDLILKNSNLRNAHFKCIHVKGAAILDNSKISYEVDFSESKFEKEFTFKDAEVAGETNFSKAIFIKEADFQNGLFGSDADFSGAVFKDDALFTQRECKGSLDISLVNVKGEAHFNVNGIQENANFSESKFEKEFTLAEVEIHGESNFTGVLFKKEANFSKANFNSTVSFSNGVFSKSVSFLECAFKGSNDNSNPMTAVWFPEKLTGCIYFEKTTFKKEVDFQNTVFYADAYFSDSEFRDNTLFVQMESKGSFIAPAIKVGGKALFNGNIIQGDMDLSESKFEKESIFKDAEITGDVIFSNVVIEGKASFENGFFGANTDFSESTFEDDAVFTQREFKGNANFEKVIIRGRAYFDVNGIQGDANFSEALFENESTFKDVKITGDANFSHATLKGEAIFENVVFAKDVYFKEMTTKDISFKKVKFTALETNENENFNLSFNRSKFGKIDFSSSNISKDLTCENSTFAALTLQNTTISRWSEIVFREVKIDSLIFNSYINDSEKILYDFVTVNKKLEIKHVSFDKERFNHFDMSSAHVEIENSAFNDNFFNSVKWGTISEKRFKASRDIFRQLKYHSEKQKNFIDADGFYSLEMKEQKKELHKENKKISSVWEKISHFFTNTLIFHLHEKTSNFSQNWLLPIFWLFILGMMGTIYIKLTEIRHHHPFLEMLLYIVVIAIIFNSLFYIFLVYYDYKKNTFLSNKKAIYALLIFIPVVIVYFHYTDNFLNDIAALINPSKIFSIADNRTAEIKKSSTFFFLLYKIAILFLIYQVIASIKKKVRSK